MRSVVARTFVVPSLGRRIPRHRRRSGVGGDAGFLITAFFVGLSLVIGGAGVEYPLNQLVVEVLGIIVICMTALRKRVPDGVAFRAILGVFLAALVLMALQLVPIPPALWHGLAGRSVAVQIYDTLGWGTRWHAASLTPDATFLGMLAVLPAMAAFVATATLTERKRLWLLRVVVAVAFLGALLGIFQVATAAEDAPVLFDTSHRGFGVGFFVNRNHQATFLLVAIALAAAPGVVWFEDQGRGLYGRRASVLAFVAFLAIGVLATTSRTGLALLPVALIAIVIIIVERGRVLNYLLGSIGLYSLAAAAFFQSDLVQRTLARFATASDDLRYQYWDNTRYAIGQAFPWGTGFGSFDAVYQSVEPLAQLTSLRVNHAHSDYLEVALEGGLPGIVLVATGIVVAFGVFWLAWRRPASRSERSRAVAAAAGFIMILLCSVVDYPMRMSEIGILAGVLLALAVPPPRAGRAHRVGPVLRGTILLGGAAVSWMALSAGLATSVMQHGNPTAAVRLAPWLAKPWSQLANAEQLDLRPAASAAAAARALAIAPMDPSSVRALGIAKIALNDSTVGAALLRTGGLLGWRDTANQIWLVDQALKDGDLRVGAQRIDGLIRRHIAMGVLQRQLRSIFLLPGGADAVAERLTSGAPWRQGFLNTIADDAPGHVPLILHLLTALDAKGVSPKSEETALIRWRLGDAGNYRAARQVWLHSGGKGLLADGTFTALSGLIPAGGPPYSWRAPSSAGVRVSVVQPDAGTSNRSLVVASDGFATGPVLAQTVLLAAGTYDFRLTLDRSAGASPLTTWSIACLGAGGLTESIPIRLNLSRTESGAWRSAGRFEVLPSCTASVLTMSLKESAGQPFTLTLDDVAIAATTSGSQRRFRPLAR